MDFNEWVRKNDKYWEEHMSRMRHNMLKLDNNQDNKYDFNSTKVRPRSSVIYDEQVEHSEASESSNHDSSNSTSLSEKCCYEYNEDGELYFKIEFDAINCEPENIAVSCKGNNIYLTIYDNKKQEKIHKSILLPDKVDSEHTRCYLTEDGVLILEAPVLKSGYKTIQPSRSSNVEGEVDVNLRNPSKYKESNTKTHQNQATSSSYLKTETNHTVIRSSRSPSPAVNKEKKNDMYQDSYIKRSVSPQVTKETNQTKNNYQRSKMTTNEIKDNQFLTANYQYRRSPSPANIITEKKESNLQTSYKTSRSPSPRYQTKYQENNERMNGSSLKTSYDEYSRKRSPSPRFITEKKESNLETGYRTERSRSPANMTQLTNRQETAFERMRSSSPMHELITKFEENENIIKPRIELENGRKRLYIDIPVDGDYEASDFVIKTQNKTITITGKHHEESNRSQSSKQFMKSFTIAENIEQDTVKCTMSGSILKIQAWVY